MILSESESRRIIERALSFSSADEIRVNLSGGRSGNTRFALNSITTSGDEDTLSVRVLAYFGKQHANASGTEFTDDALQRIVQTAEEAARIAPEDPEYVPELQPQTYLPIKPYFSSTAAATPQLRAKGVQSSIEPSINKDLLSAGFFSNRHGFSAVGNNHKLFGYYQSSNASFSVTTRTQDGSGSGWGSDSARNIDQVDYQAASRRALEKAEASSHSKTLEPGTYPVILDPLAVADFIAMGSYALNARSADEGRSLFSKAGGGNKTGEKVAGDNVTMRSDPTHPELLGSPFGGDGQPAKKNTWVKNGVLRQLFYDRYWAEKQGKEPTGYPSSIIIEGDKGTLDDLISNTDRAVLVTRFWYIRFVDPQSLLLTGLTRDGTFWVENGRIQHAIKNFRFNESPMAVLNKITDMSESVRVGGSMVPAIRASEFTFSSLSDAV